MSDDARDALFDVLRRSYPRNDSCDCGTCRSMWAAHVAAEIDTALGGLTQQRRELPAKLSGDLTSYATRWVGGWTLEETP